ncbi:uncharacterized protein LOC135482027 isoform X2 [Liolophura sinensis]|uniref:uncharacterized protein LOC135482027 isoform X2 n=1 Tax=Liolophura sinensis TaxID=3198878 RepID=UPI003158CA43
MYKVTVLLVLLTWIRYSAQQDEFVHEINLSACEANVVRILKLPVIFSIHGAGRKPKAPENSSSADTCDLVINVDMPSTGLEAHFVKRSQFLQDMNISVFHSRHNAEQNATLFTTDSPDLTTSMCMTSHDGVMTLRMFYHVTSELMEIEKFFYLKSVDQCRLNSSVPDRESGEGDGPRVGTSVKIETNGPPPKASVDIIIITGVVVAVLIGLIVAGFAIRRWIGNSMAEERRLSQIRVNSHSSHTRSTSPSRRSNQSRASVDHSVPSPGTLYGSVRIGGRLPSSEDESDMFADTKSTKTDIDVV